MSARDRTQDLMHTGHLLYHTALLPVLDHTILVLPLTVSTFSLGLNKPSVKGQMVNIYDIETLWHLL